MVANSDAIVDKKAVMVVSFHTSVANHTVEGILGYYRLVVGAELVKLNALIKGLVNHSHIIELFLYMAWFKGQGENETRET